MSYAEQMGYTREQLPDDCECYRRPGGGFVTVDFSRRIFGLGYGWPRRHDGTAAYLGTRWRDRLIRDAIDHLENTMKEHA